MEMVSRPRPCWRAQRRLFNDLHVLLSFEEHLMSVIHAWPCIGPGGHALHTHMHVCVDIINCKLVLHTHGCNNCNKDMVTLVLPVQEWQDRRGGLVHYTMIIVQLRN